MFDATLYLAALPVLLILILPTWIASILKRDVSIVDSTWSLMLLAMAFTYTAPAWMNGELSLRATLLLLMVSAWALRLSIYISWRNHGEGEDRRYQAIRRKHEPGFAFKIYTWCLACRHCSHGLFPCRCWLPPPAAHQSAHST